MLILCHSPNIATAIGPIIGGALAEFSGWRWIFWLLSMLSGACLLLIAFFSPETARSVVGNGSNHVSRLRRPVFSYIESSGSSQPPDKSNRTDTLAPEMATRQGYHIPNPARSLRLL